MKLAIKHPGGVAVTELIARSSATVRHVLDRFREVSGVAGSLQVRKGHSVLRLAATLSGSGVVPGDMLSVELRLSPRQRALRRRAQSITKRSTAHDHRGRRPAASGKNLRGRAQPMKRTGADMSNTEKDGTASTRGGTADGTASTKGGTVSETTGQRSECLPCRRQNRRLRPTPPAPPAPAPPPAPVSAPARAARVPKADDILPKYLLKHF